MILDGNLPAAIAAAITAQQWTIMNTPHAVERSVTARISARSKWSFMLIRAGVSRMA